MAKYLNNYKINAKNIMRKFLLVIIISSSLLRVFGQNHQIDYFNPRKYTLAGLTVSGIKFLSPDVLKLLSGLEVGQEIILPGDDITDAIEKLWAQNLFSDVKISITSIKHDSVYLDIYLKEQARLNKVYFYGINKTQEKDLKDKLGLTTGKQMTKNLLRNSEIIIKNYYEDKGFPNVAVSFKLEDDTIYQNTVNLFISIDKKNKTKINKIVIRGNSKIKDRQVRRFMKDTKQKNFFRFWKASKFIADKYEDDKKKIIEKYNELGYRDARIVEDSVYNVNNKLLNIYIKINEGDKYYYRNIEWIGNTKYTSEQLTKTLDIKAGDPYNQKELQKRLFTDETSITNLYMNNGYLFFHVIPQEKKIENDSIDMKIFVYEGPQATINNIDISGNTRTNDYVIRRELKTLPGELFSREDVMRSVRELASLGQFDPEQLNPVPLPNHSDGTVDIKYNVVETPNDRFELSGGYGGIYGVTGRIGISFNNFEMKNLFKPKKWDPLPMGNSEKLSISANVGGPAYQLYSISYVNPWFGGKKPNSFSTSIYYNRMSNSYSYKVKPTGFFYVYGASVGFGKRLKVPDDYFILSTNLAFDKYVMDNNRGYIDVGNGKYNIISLTTTLARTSTDNPIFTRRGSDISVSVKLTPPYSLFTNKTWEPGADSLKFKWNEFYKISIKGAWYNQIVKNLVLSTRFEYGLLGYYNKNIGYTPFEGYEVGGSPMGYYTFGKDIISLRGYKDHSLTPTNGAHLYSKYTMELRYPIIMEQMAKLYVLSFTEAGNAWYDLNEFNPFKLYRSAGVGARLMIPMLGMVGVDVAYGFDDIPGKPGQNAWNFHFLFGQKF